MKTVKLTVRELDLLPLSSVALPLWIGSNDIIVYDGQELIDHWNEVHEDDDETSNVVPTLSVAFYDCVRKQSGNSFELLVIHSFVAKGVLDGVSLTKREICKVDIGALFDSAKAAGLNWEE